MSFWVRANFLKDFPLELLLSPRHRAKANIRAMTRRAEINSSKSNTDPVVIGRPFGAAKMCNMRRRKLIFYDVSVFGY